MISATQPWAIRQHWVLPVVLLLLVTLQAVSTVFGWGGQVGKPLTQASVISEVFVANHNQSTVTTFPRYSVQELSAAIQAAEFLVLELWQATPDPTAPIESLEWLAVYFRRGWGPELSKKLASYYSYFDGEGYYLRFTDNILPPLVTATMVTINVADERSAVLEAEFPAMDGPVQYPALTQVYCLIKEGGTWKIDTVRLKPTSVTTVAFQ